MDKTEREQIVLDRARQDIETRIEELSECEDPVRVGNLQSTLSGDKQLLGERLVQFRGEYDAARELFGEAVDHELESIRTRRTAESLTASTDHWQTLPTQCWDGLFLALVSQDAALQREMAEETLSLPPEYLDVFPSNAPKFHYAKLLAATVLEDDAAAEYLRDTRRSVDANDEFESVGQAGMLTALDGVVTGDPAAVTDGIETHLDQFRQTAPNPAENIDFRAVGMVLLARKHGYDVDVESPNVPAELLELDDDG